MDRFFIIVCCSQWYNICGNSSCIIVRVIICCIISILGVVGRVKKFWFGERGQVKFWCIGFVENCYFCSFKVIYQVIIFCVYIVSSRM